MLRLLQVICFLGIGSFAVRSQSPGGFHIQQFNTENGLPSNGIKGLQFDEQTGFLWIATEAGIVRFNGSEFKTFNSNDEPHITNERILFLIRNNQGGIITADFTGNMFKIRKNRLAYLGKKKITGNPGSNIVSAAVSERLFNFLGDFKTSVPFTIQFDKIIPASDTSCFIVQAGRLYYFSLSVPTPMQILKELPPVSTAFTCSGEVFLVMADKKIFHLDKPSLRLTKHQIEFDPGAPKPEIEKSLIRWENGMKYPFLFFRGRGWKIICKEGKLSASLVSEKIPDDILIRYVQYDEERNTLFIGTDSKGVVAVKKNRVESLKLFTPGLNARTSYYTQVELSNGNILTNEGHIIGKNNPANTPVPFKGKVSDNIFMTKDSSLWYYQFYPPAGHSCLHRYDFHTGKTTSYFKITETYKQPVLAESGGRVYVVNEKGLFRISGDSTELVFAYPGDIATRIHCDVKETEPGVLLIANCNALLRFDIQKKQLDTLYNSGSYCVRTIWPYKNYIFFGTYGGGLFVMKNGVVKPLPLDKNKYLLYTHCFINDNKGYCWISTNRGLFKVGLPELTDVFERDSRSVYYHYFGRNDGMEMTELNGGCTPCAIRTQNNTLSFPSMDGLLWVHPDGSAPILPTGEIYIDDIIADNKFINPDSLSFSELPAKTKDLVVRFSVPAWCNKENLYIHYRLNNDPEWKMVNIEKGMELHFSNLAPGKYTLTINKQNGFGADNSTHKEIQFAINTPWTRRWWFYVICYIGAFGIVWLYFILRTRQFRIQQSRLQGLVSEKTRALQDQNEVLEKNNAIKTRLISIISHDIVTPLKFLTVAGKNLLEKRKLMPEELQQETIQEMTNTSQELQMLSTNILNWIKYQNENRRLAKENFLVHELVNQVLGILNSLARQKNLTLLNKVDPDLVLFQFIEPLKILIYNLVSNAINFSESGTIVISEEQKKDVIIIKVADEGVGMTPEQIQNIMADQFIISSANIDKRKGNGLGYLIIKDLIKMMGAELSIKSEKGAGTVVSIIIPREGPNKSA